VEIIGLSILALIVIFLMMGVKIVPQSQNYLVERLGRYNRTLEAGLHIVIPIFEMVRHKVDILERQLPTKEISTITLDNVTIGVELAILYRITEASKSIYRIQNVDQAIQTTVTGVVRSVIGKTDLDGVQSNRRELSEAIEEELRAVTQEWGIVLSRVEIIDVQVDEETKSAMQLQLNAERTRRAIVRQAEGEKESKQLQADAELYSAQKLAEARKILAEADAYAVSVVAKAISEGGESAINFEVKKIQAEAIKVLGSQNNTKLVLLPADLLESLSSMTSRIVGKL
jgi:regulator of protease activity HflC (stomatin/prohibitin superfamily)